MERAMGYLVDVCTNETLAFMELALDDSRRTGKLPPGWGPPPYTNQDTIPSPAGESRVKEFRSLKLGAMRIEKCLGPPTLRAFEIHSKFVMEVRSVTLSLLNGD